MSKKINLFIIKRQREAFLAVLKKIRIILTIASLLFFFFFLLTALLQIQIKNTINKLNNEKQNYLNFLLEYKNSEAKLKYFYNKNNLLKQYLTEDARFYPYYQLLNEAISAASESAKIQSLTTEKDRKTSFAIVFTDYQSMINFLHYIETPTFLDNFHNLALTSFNLGSNFENGYQLSFEGTFKEINDKNF